MKVLVFTIFILKTASVSAQSSTTTAPSSKAQQFTTSAASIPLAMTSTPSPNAAPAAPTSHQVCCSYVAMNVLPTSPPTTSCSSPFGWLSCATNCYNYKCFGTSSLGTGNVYYSGCGNGTAAQSAQYVAVILTALGASGVTCTPTTGITA